MRLKCLRGQGRARAVLARRAVRVREVIWEGMTVVVGRREGGRKGK